MWEDEKCKDGGRWTLRVQKSHTNKYWEDLVLAMLGEQFSTENEINGLVIGLKPNSDTISIWNKHGKDAAKIQ
jgi:translation initiation factor 4E